MLIGFESRGFAARSSPANARPLRVGQWVDVPMPQAAAFPRCAARAYPVGAPAVICAPSLTPCGAPSAQTVVRQRVVVEVPLSLCARVTPGVPTVVWRECGAGAP